MTLPIQKIRHKDASGRFTQKSVDGNPNDIFRTGLLKAFTGSDSVPVQEEFEDGSIFKIPEQHKGLWRVKPPTVEEFFTSWFPEPLYPLQHAFVENVIGANPWEWSKDYDEGHAFWGKGAGKDRTIAKMMAYVTAKLHCMVNPQEGLNKLLGGGLLGIDSAIDIVNVSKDADQAREVFFKNLKTVLRQVRNPYTGNLFFEECGVDLREGYDIQSTQINLKHNITCFSLNSKRYAGEGLNLFFVVADEVGAMPAMNVKGQLTSIRETLDSRFPKIGKLILMSYKYEQNCPMSVEYKLGEKNPRIYSSRFPTFKVNPQKKKSDYSRHYLRDSTKAQWTYECKDINDTGGGFIKQKFIIPWCFNNDLMVNPTKDEVITTANIRNLRFEKEFFQSLKGKMLALHVDLAKAKDKTKSDCAGLALSYPELITPRIHPQSVKLLKKINVLDADNVDLPPRKGVKVPLAIQLQAEIGSEIQFSDIIDFIKYLKANGVNIFKVTYDGWQSVGEIQRVLQMGINAEVLSVDKTTAPYDTAKSLLYLGLLHSYENTIAIREFDELIVDDKGKIDHPEVSWKRLEQEGTDLGSKDVSDCIAGSAYTCMEEISLDTGIVW